MGCLIKLGQKWVFILSLVIFSIPLFSTLCPGRTEKEVGSNAGKEEQMRDKMSSGTEKSTKNRQRGKEREEEES